MSRRADVSIPLDKSKYALTRQKLIKYSEFGRNNLEDRLPGRKHIKAAVSGDELKMIYRTVHFPPCC
jgi:hypothetical protein